MDLTVTATLDTPTIGTIGPLDSVLSWAAWQLAEQNGIPFEPITDEHCPDFDLPLSIWKQDGYWGWCSSLPMRDVTHHSSAEIRRRPATTPMSIYTKAREHHSGLGPMKARNVTLPTEYSSSISWHVDCQDKPSLRRLLQVVTHIGARHRNGFGHITEWSITPGVEDGWMHRPMPAPTGRYQRVRAPYWHPTERTTCQIS